MIRQVLTNITKIPVCGGSSSSALKHLYLSSTNKIPARVLYSIQCRHFQSSECPPNEVDAQHLPTLLKQEPKSINIETNNYSMQTTAEQEPVRFPSVSYTDYHPLEKDPLWESAAPVPPQINNLAAFVNKSELLRHMVNLGVSLYQWDKMKDVNSWVLKMDFDTDVKPVIQFLVDSDVPADNLGVFFTKYPQILKTPLADLEVRKNYLEAKKFTPEMIGRIFTRNPGWLLHSTKEIDKQLGFFQLLFKISGNQVRSLAVKEPRLITSKLDAIKAINFGLREEMGFDAIQLKSLLMVKPKLWLMNKSILVDRFDYLHNTVKMDHTTILMFPSVLTTRGFRLRQRHEFLRHLNRNQYDPKMPNYISPLDLIRDTDANFATEVAKSSVDLFNQFCKTM